MVSAKDFNSFAIKTDGTLWAWGQGWLIDGTYTDKTEPIKIGSDTNWKQISAGSDFALALKTDGTAWAWGNNSVGQLGDGTLISRYSPIQIDSAKDWKQVATATWAHSFGFKTDGSLWGWGRNFHGQLGDGTNIDKIIPIKLDVTNCVYAAGGDSYTLILKSNDQYCGTGNNAYGQLGNGTINISNRYTFNCFDIPTSSFALKSAEMKLEEPILQPSVSLHSILFESYPNPTQGDATINYVLAKDANNAKIVVSNLFDMVIREYPVYEGTTSLKIDIQNLPAGIYLYSLMVNGVKIDVKKLLLIK